MQLCRGQTNLIVIIMADQWNTQVVEDELTFKLYTLAHNKPRLVGVYKKFSEAQLKADKLYDNYKITEVRKVITERDKLTRRLT